MMADLIIRTDGPLVVLLIGLAVYMTREVIAESLADHCGRPLQLMALFSAMLWAEGLGRVVALVRRSAQFEGLDSSWVLDSWLRFAINLLPAGVAIGLVIWLAIPRWSFRTAVWLGSLTGLCVGLFVWPDPVLFVAFEVYRAVAYLTHH